MVEQCSALPRSEGGVEWRFCSRRTGKIEREPRNSEGDVQGNQRMCRQTGGEQKYKDRVTTLLELMGSFISYVGGAGTGQAAKVVNNLILGVSVTVNCEAMDLAQRLGLDLKAFFEIVKHSSGDNWSFRLWNPAPGVVAEARRKNRRSIH
jgi:hypothetical protein